MFKIDKSWELFFKEELKKDYFKKLMVFVNKEYKAKKCYPSYDCIFRVLKMKIEQIKIVILGQDPYPSNDFADGLSFSNNGKKELPKSLINIFKEIEKDYGIKNENGSLENWEKQGIFLLNSCLTVEQNKPNSHINQGWEIFTTNLLKYLNMKSRNILYLAWGKNAMNILVPIIDKSQLMINSHPSLLSYNLNFKDKKIFLLANEWLEQRGIEKINWITNLVK